MGALNREYLYKLLEEEAQISYDEAREASKKSIYNKFVTAPAAKFGARLGTSILGPQGAFTGGMLGALTGGIGTTYLKTSVAGNLQTAQNIASRMPFEFLHDPQLIQFLAVTPYLLSQFSRTQSQINNLRAMDLKFQTNQDFAKYGPLAAYSQATLNFMKGLSLFGALGSGTAAALGAGKTAALLAHFNPIGLLMGNPLLGLALGGLSFAGSSLLASFGKQFSQKNPRIPLPHLLPGSTLLATQSSYNFFKTQIQLLTSQGVLRPYESMVLSLLNEINLNTTPLKIEFQNKTLNEGKYQNAVTRNKLLDIYAPESVEPQHMLLSSGEGLSLKDIQKRKAAYHLNMTTSLLFELGLAALAGPFAKLFTGRSYGETRQDIFDILLGNNNLRAQAFEEANKRLQIPSDLMTALYTPVSKWLQFDDFQSQQLAILANMHELLRSSALSLVGINKTLGGNQIGKKSIYSLLQDLEEEYLGRYQQPEELGFLESMFGPLLGKGVKGLFKLGKIGFRSVLFPIIGSTLFMTSKLFGSGKLYDNYMNSFAGEFIGIRGASTGIKNFLFSRVSDVLRNSLIGQSLLRRLGYVDKETIDKTFQKAIKEIKSYDKQKSAYTFLSDYFPDITQSMLHELKQQTIYLKNLLDCMDCKSITLQKSSAKWRGAFGKFLEDEEYENYLKAHALGRVKRELGYKNLKNMNFGFFSKFFYNRFFGIKEEEFHELADYINSLNTGKIYPSSEIDYDLRNLNTTSIGALFRNRQNRTQEISDDQLQENLKRKRIEEERIRREIILTKTVKTISKHTAYIEKIFNLLKNNLIAFYRNANFAAGIASAGDGLSLWDILKGALIGGGAWLFKKLRDRFKRRPPRRTPERRYETDFPNRPQEDKNKNRKKPKKVNEKPRKIPTEERIPNKRPTPTEERIPRTPRERPQPRTRRLPNFGQKLKTYSSKAKKLAQRFLRILRKILLKRGLESVWIRFASALTTEAVLSIGTALESGGISVLIGALAALGTISWFVYNYWDEIVEAYNEFTAGIKAEKQAKKLEESYKRNHHYLAGLATKKEFDSLINQTNKEVFRGKYYRHGRVYFDNKVHFKTEQEKNLLTTFTTDALERIYKYSKKYREFASDTDESRMYKFIQFKKFIEKHHLQDKFYHMSNEEIQSAFKEFSRNIEEFKKDYIASAQQSTQINAGVVQVLSDIRDLLTKILNIDSKELNALQIIASKTIRDLKTVTIMPKS